jgi:hypothetical protein
VKKGLTVTGMLLAALAFVGNEWREEKAARRAAEERVISLQKTYHALVTRLVP